MTKSLYNLVREVCPEDGVSPDYFYYEQCIRHIDELRGNDHHQINTLNRLACFLGQLAVESARFTAVMERGSDEYLSYLIGKLGNRNLQEALAYRGRGPIQLTGRLNYEFYSQLIFNNQNLVDKPERVSSEPFVGALTALHYWTSRKLNQWADQLNHRELTRRIQGADGLLSQRISYTTKFLKLLKTPKYSHLIIDPPKADPLPSSHKTIEFSDYRDLGSYIWAWDNFSPRELTNIGTTHLIIHEPSLDKLQQLRGLFNRPIFIAKTEVEPDYYVYHLNLINYKKAGELDDLQREAKKLGFRLRTVSNIDVLTYRL